MKTPPIPRALRALARTTAAVAAAALLFAAPDARAQSTSAFCFGDGTDLIGNCPCGVAQNGTPGSGCLNSSGASGTMVAVGNSCVSVGCGVDTLQLGAVGLPPAVNGLLVQGTAALSPGVYLGDGIRCFGGNFLRLFVGQTTTAGNIVFPPAATTISARSAALGDVIPVGGIRHYQIYYRDPPAFCTASPFNLTNGTSVVWR